MDDTPTQDQAPESDVNKIVAAAPKKAAITKAKDVGSKVKKQDESSVVFVSANPEAHPIPILCAGEVIHSGWNPDHTHLTWIVPAEIAHRFRMHEFYMTGRIIDAE